MAADDDCSIVTMVLGEPLWMRSDTWAAMGLDADGGEGNDVLARIHAIVRQEIDFVSLLYKLFHQVECAK